MKMTITDTTDGKYYGIVIEDSFPVMLDDDVEFMPSAPPILIGPKIRRYFNSNYQIDVVLEQEK